MKRTRSRASLPSIWVNPSTKLSRHQGRALRQHAKATDQAVEGDRRFFARFPDRRYRVRLLSSAERAQIEAIQGGTLNLRPVAPIAFAAIKQLAPGVRLRAIVFGPEVAVGEELTEEEARSVWEGYADYHPEVRQREALMLDAMGKFDGSLHRPKGGAANGR